MPVDSALQLRLLGPLALRRAGLPLALPASRKARALLAYLALARLPLSRSQLCELLWDLPSDPRGELRWCLTKIRRLVDSPERARIVTRDNAIRLDTDDCFIDAMEVARAGEQGFSGLTTEQQKALCGLFQGEFLEGLEIERNPAFNAWLTAQRRRFRGLHVALLEQLARSAPGEEALGYLEKWLELSPFDREPHERLLTALARHGLVREGEEHLAATVRQFQAEGLDAGPIVQLWQSARSREIVTVQSGPLAAASGPRRASIAVMPFSDRSPAAPPRGGPADALAHDVITRLAKLRALFVIAQGTVFALQERGLGTEEAARMLNVDYAVSGSVQRRAERLAVTVELADMRTARVVWAETFNRPVDDALLILEEIGNHIVASIVSEIEMLERNRALLKPPSSLDAWEAHHRGLWHMYRFSKADNEQARHFFEMAVRLDPTFARAHAGLSFTHWQNAFQGWAERAPAMERAFEAAGQSVMVDDRDPTAHWAMGRALWLRGRHADAVLELERAVDLSPNFALGHYTLAFVHSQAGDAHAAISASDQSRHLSPFDPMMFGMLGARAMALVRLHRFDEAAEWAVKAAARPNAHAHIHAIAAFSLSLAGSLEQARGYAAAVRHQLPRYRVEEFLRAFQFDDEGVALFREGAKRLAMA
jgi:DNA-binding SARP family transcriptional activator